MRIYCALLLFILLVSCKKQEKVPDYVLPEPKFVRILVDYNIAQGLNGTLLYKNKADYFKEYAIVDSVFTRHGIPKWQFDSSLSYYSQNPKKLDEIYDKVMKEFASMSADIQSKLDKKKKAEKSDSLKNSGKIKIKEINAVKL